MKGILSSFLRSEEATRPERASLPQPSVFTTGHPRVRGSQGCYSNQTDQGFHQSQDKSGYRAPEIVEPAPPLDKEKLSVYGCDLSPGQQGLSALHPLPHPITSRPSSHLLAFLGAHSLCPALNPTVKLPAHPPGPPDDSSQSPGISLALLKPSPPTALHHRWPQLPRLSKVISM